LDINIRDFFDGIGGFGRIYFEGEKNKVVVFIG
jgi:hypothetical protein